ncbi:hypothetical protein [Parvularcula sp. LCG005]|uniref:hypothetical protein n=1 Tax=Parvularcula sp. LCG005 TaxID=3078805 RepID=UPI0029422B04|nr:hypothetical protein [Parvularcula sp. LCG005]WOI52540.1 hypothetical protein RUI03_10315 [Parvularcula sp. LCG005]
MFDVGALAQFATAYPAQPAVLAHSANEHPLFSLPRLTILAGSLPRRCVELRSADTGAEEKDPTPPALLVQALSARDDVMSLREIGHDEEYAQWLSETVRPFVPFLRGVTGANVSVDGEIVLCSPDVATQWPSEGEGRIWMQCRGQSTAALGTRTFELGEGEAIFAPKGEDLTVTAGNQLGIAVVLSWPDDEAEGAPGHGSLLSLLWRKIKSKR